MNLLDTRSNKNKTWSPSRLCNPLQIKKDKVELLNGTPLQTPVKLGTTLIKHKDKGALSKKMHNKYWVGIGKHQHLIHNSWPDIRYVEHELSRYLVQLTKTQYNANVSTIQYIMNSTANQGLVLNPFRHWDGTSEDYIWTIWGHIDFSYATNPDN